MYQVREAVISVDTAGGDGVAAGSSTSAHLTGYLESVYLDYHASAPATTDVTITFATRGGTIMAVANNATDGYYAPQNLVADAAGADVAGVYTKILLNQPITVTVAQANALTACVTAYITYIGW